MSDLWIIMKDPSVFKVLCNDLDLWLLVGWLYLWIYMYVASAVFQPYRDLEAGDNQSLKIQVARPVIEPRSS